MTWLQGFGPRSRDSLASEWITPLGGEMLNLLAIVDRLLCDECGSAAIRGIVYAALLPSPFKRFVSCLALRSNTTAMRTITRPILSIK